MHYEVCPRCGTTVRLTGKSGKYRYGKCPNCGNKVISKE